MNYSFTLKNWSAWMPGISSPEQWRQWAAGELDIQHGASRPVPELAPMLRRRLSGLGKMAVGVAIAALDGAENVPSVFSSRHGELDRTVGLLSELAQGQPLSPTHFSLSVHNAVGGVMSIARKDTSSITALATSNGDFSLAILEALAILQEGAHQQVLCVVYDEPVPEVYSANDDNLASAPRFPYAVAFMVAASGSSCAEDELHFSIDHHSVDKGLSAPSEPQAMTLLRFVLSEQITELVLPAHRHGWHWSKSLPSDEFSIVK